MYKFTCPREDYDNGIDKKTIRKLIEKHVSFAEKFDRCESYYLGKHDILGRTKKNKNMANNRIVCNHARYIADISTGYFLGNPITYSSEEDISRLTDELKGTGADGIDTQNALNMAKYGLAYEYVYAKEGEARLCIKSLSPKNTFIVCDDTIEESELFAVYYYAKKDDIKGKLKYTALVFDREHITEHTFYGNDGGEYEVSEPIMHNLGEIPVVEYKNNEDGIGDYELQISLIDAYNTLMSDRLNDKEQFLDAILVLYGTILSDGEEQGNAARKRLRESGLLEMSEGAKVEYLTKTLDETGVETIRKAIENDIHKFSYVPCLTDECFAGNASGVAMEYKLLGLEMIAKIKTDFYRKGLQKRLRLFGNYLNIQQAGIDTDKICITFTRGLPKNLIEIAQTVSTLNGVVSQETLLAQIPFVENAAGEMEKIRAEKEENIKNQQAIFGGMRNNEPLEGEDNGEE